MLAALGLALALALAVVGPALAAVGQAPVSPTPSPSSRPAQTSDLPRERALAEREVFGFLPHWELSDAGSIDLAALTTLAWFGLEAGSDGRLVRETEGGGPTPGWAGWTGETFGELMDRAQAADVRVVLTAERFAWDAPGVEATTALLLDPTSRAVLVSDIVDTVTERGADGVNLDFEPLPTAVRGAFTRLVRELRTGLDAADPTLQLTFDLPAAVTGYWLKPLTAEDAADAVVLMGYEYRSGSSPIAGSVAPLKDPDELDLRESVKRVLARVPADRVILALPWYDQVQASAWSAYRSSACETCPISWRQLWFDDVDAFRAKVRFAVRKELRGVGIWALGHQGGAPGTVVRAAARIGGQLGHLATLGKRGPGRGERTR